MKNKVVALGELLIDFTPIGLSEKGHPQYEQNAGGAPANVAVAVSKLGGASSVISAVGEDFFADFLEKTLQDHQVDTVALQRIPSATTTLAFVSLNERGDRSFCFARKPGADMLLCKDSIPSSFADDCGIFHFGSISLGAEKSKEATLWAAESAKKKGALISYDPNWREALWPDREEGIEAMKLGLSLSQIVKLSEEELELLSSFKDEKEGTDWLFSMYPDIQLIVVTLGPKGCFYRTKSLHGFLPTYDVKVVDTTGSGDSFWGCLLHSIVNDSSLLENNDRAVLEKALYKANAAGAICASARGAIGAIPTEKDIQQTLSEGKLLFL